MHTTAKTPIIIDPIPQFTKGSIDVNFIII
jgi:hypothetical protein